VSFLAARLVGPTGTVLGVDRAVDVIDFARARAAELDISTVRFEQSAIETITVDEPVDAVIGRFILVHLPEPVATLRHLATLVRPGGLIAFGETDITGLGSAPGQPLVRAARQAITAVFGEMGVDAAFGRRLHGLFLDAGLSPPRLRLGGPLGGASDSDVLACVADAWRSLYPRAARLGLGGDELGDPETLFSRLREQVAQSGAVVMLPSLITAWTRV